MPAKWAGRLVLVRWQLERPMYDFKNSFSPDLYTFIEQNIFFPETCFVYPISEQKFKVCFANLIDQNISFTQSQDLSLEQSLGCTSHREFLQRNGVGRTCLWKKYILLYECRQNQGKDFEIVHWPFKLSPN